MRPSPPAADQPGGPSADRPELWHFPFSHFNEKVRWALDHQGIDYADRVLCPGLHVPTALRLTGQLKTPILRIGHEVLHDSTAILIELARRYPERSLLPAEEPVRGRVLALEDHYDTLFGEDVRTLFYACYWPDWRACADVSTLAGAPFARTQFMLMYPLLKPLLFFKMKLRSHHIAAAEERLFAGLDELAAELAGKRYLLEDRFTLADLTASALLSGLVGPAEFPYQLPAPVPARLQAYRRRLDEHPAIFWVRRNYAEHRLREPAVG